MLTAPMECAIVTRRHHLHPKGTLVKKRLAGSREYRRLGPVLAGTFSIGRTIGGEESDS